MISFRDAKALGPLDWRGVFPLREEEMGTELKSGVCLVPSRLLDSYAERQVKEKRANAEAQAGKEEVAPLGHLTQEPEWPRFSPRW